MRGSFLRSLAVMLGVVGFIGLGVTTFAGKMVPIEGEFATEFAFTKVEFPLPPPFDTVPVVTLTVSGAGQASHLGRTTCFSDNEVVDFTQGGKLTGTLTLTAANQDTLKARMDAMATVDGNTVSFAGSLTFIGGTGRFANATGTASFEGGASPATGPTGAGWFEFEGEVSSPGASKK